MLSIVSTIYRSELTLREFVRRCRASAEELGGDYEIVLVDDGSPDGSRGIALELASSDPRITVVELSRNFGHHHAMLCALEWARGDCVFLIDSDLEESPEWLLEFAAKAGEGSCDVVYGVQERRRDSGLRAFGGRLHYLLRRVLVDPNYPTDVTMARLMSRPYVDALLLHRESTSTILDLWVATGFRQLGVPVEKLSVSPTTYSFVDRARMLMSSFVIASGRVLVASSLFGLFAVVLALIASVALVVQWGLIGRPVPGWTSVMLVVIFLGGSLLLTSSLIGLNLARVAMEVRGRPRAIVRAVHSGSPRTADENVARSVDLAAILRSSGHGGPP